MNAKLLATLFALISAALVATSGWFYQESTDLSEQNDTLSTENSALATDNRELRQRLSELEPELERLGNQVQGLEAERNQLIDTVAEQKAELSRQSETLADRNLSLESLKERLATLNDNALRQADRIQGLRAEQIERSRLLEELAAANNRISVLEQSDSDARTALKEERDALRTDLQEAHQAHADSRDRLHQVQAQLGQARQSIEEADTRLARLQTEQMTLRESLATTQALADTRQNDLDSLRDRLQSEQSRLTAEQTAHRATELQYQQALNRLHGREETVSELKARLARERSALESLQQELSLAENEQRQLIEKMDDGATVIKLPERILFSTGSARLSDDANAVLEQVAQAIDSFPDYRVVIRGHTDSRSISPGLQSIFPTNWELSAARAAAAVRRLADLGLSRTRLEATGVADTRPLVEEVDDAARRQNRRIEIMLEPEPSEVRTL